jgi:hypothetical protein
MVSKVNDLQIIDRKLPRYSPPTISMWNTLPRPAGEHPIGSLTLSRHDADAFCRLSTLCASYGAAISGALWISGNPGKFVGGLVGLPKMEKSGLAGSISSKKVSTRYGSDESSK